jgi:hypothetical protein
MSAMNLTAEHNNYFPCVVAKFCHLSAEKKTGDMFLWTERVVFDSVDGAMEPLYDKWIDVPLMLTEHLQAHAEVDDELL